MEEWDVCHSIVMAKLAPCTHGTLHYVASEVLDCR
jgi:hypothetical protein